MKVQTLKNIKLSNVVPLNTKQIKKNKYLLLMILPVIIYYVIFKYIPMYGVIIAFKRYNVYKGFFDGAWVGFRYFEEFFGSIYIWRLIRNTLMINLYDVAICFTSPVILALLLHELGKSKFKNLVQTVSYLPYFISTVVLVSMVVNFLSADNGLVNNIIALFGGNRVMFLSESKYFWFIYTAMNLWKGLGWGTIIYIAALSGIDMELYEAATVDGAGYWKKMTAITLPGLMPTIMIMFILRIGQLMDVGYESIILMYNSKIYETADVISTYVYRMGLIDANYSFATAVGLFQSAIGLILVTSANAISRKFSETSLW